MHTLTAIHPSPFLASAAKMYPSSHAPIYYVGQPMAIRASQGAAWLKSSPIIVRARPSARRRPLLLTTTTAMQTSVHSSYPSRKSATPSPPPPSDVPTAVSTLLGLTKQLQDVLRLWSLCEASEDQVSDAYLLVCMQFNATCSAFKRHGINLRCASRLA